MTYQSGPCNDRFGISVANARQSHIVTFVSFVESIGGGFGDTWGI